MAKINSKKNRQLALKTPLIGGATSVKYYHVDENKNFIGRHYEMAYLNSIKEMDTARILIVYGRRRIGKTELLEQAFRQRNLLKFEGQEQLDEAKQMEFVMQQFASYAEEPLFTKVKVNDWVEVLKYIAEKTATGVRTLYFEEVQWLANYSSKFIGALKYVWDNFFRHNKQLILILCGSSPSFMINEVIKSRALYNRSQYELPLRELNLIESKALLNSRSKSEVMDAFLSVGGMPEYLQRLKRDHSVYTSLCGESFLPGSFFAYECERIFTSSLAANKHYKKIINFLSRRRFATRNEILKHLKMKSGGELTRILDDLEICRFIEKYNPFNATKDSKLARYCISDAYLQFYFKFINPFLHKIEQGDFIKNPLQGLNMTQYNQWLGYCYERFCRKYHKQIATILGFSAVNYRAGSYFSKKTVKNVPGYQIDLLFDRDDKVITLCEIKYTQGKVTNIVIDEFERMITLFPNEKNKTLHKVLITNHVPDKNLEKRAYFDRVITLDDFFNESIW